MKLIRNFSRLLVGLVFMFSGFVKGVDPLGTAYKIEDYFLAFNMSWALPFALALSILLCTLEFGLGASMFFNLRIKKTSWILLLVMVFFTIVTFFDYLYSPVPDCGCFGDFIILTNEETFYKNLVLLFFTLIIVFQRNKFKVLLQNGPQNLFLTLSFIIFAGFSIYNYYEIPVLDFREWKVGKKMTPENIQKPDVYVTYKNKETGETKEYLSPDYPWNDSIWISNWEFVNQRIDDSKVEKLHDLIIEDFQGDDLTENYINNKKFTFIIVAWSLDKTNKKAFRNQILNLYKETSSKGYPFVVLTNSEEKDIIKFQKETHTDNIDFLLSDPIILKAMIRSNPGLILMQNGVVMGKWGFRSIPKKEELTKKFGIDL
ncbi:MAG: BT_3928 family protein [Bacteroidales bacterium]